ncbi:MAG: S9 family peptidase [Ktedonobacterales bacterium]
MGVAQHDADKPSQAPATTVANASKHMDTQAAGRLPIEPGTMQTLRTPTDAQLAPDSTQVVFTLVNWTDEQPKPRASLWLATTQSTADGRLPEPRPLTSGAADDYTPRWSPDASRIAFLSTRTDGADERNGKGEKSEKGASRKPQIYVMAAAGGKPQRLCSTPNGVIDLAWSPDGQRIAFLALEGPEPARDPIVVTSGRYRRLWSVRADEQGADSAPEPVTPPNVAIWEYAWSPDSASFVVFASSGPDETDWYSGQIGVVAAAGGAIRHLAASQGQAGAFTWAPDGAQIAYVSGEWSDRGLVGGDVFIIPADGSGEPRNLTPGITFSPSWLRWLPTETAGADGTHGVDATSGKQLLYAAWDGVSHQIGLLDEATGALTTLDKGFLLHERGWPTLSTTPDLRAFAVTHSSATQPPDVFYGELTKQADKSVGNGAAVATEATYAGVSWRRVTRLNPIAEETLALVPDQRVEYAGADGWTIEGLYTPPLRWNAAQGAPPLVLCVHGGPTSASHEDWGGWVAQLLASAGFAVLRPNIRGSMGRGVAFANAVLGDMGGKDYEDAMCGVDAMVARGLGDSARLGIVGWSYGGFMTAWTVSQTTRFKAAVMGAGVCDFHSFHAQTNIQQWDERFLKATPNGQPGAYRERSAITYAERITTPTLIIQGENDPCVPVNQAYAFYHALRENRVATDLVVYPREGHGFTERDHLRDWQERLVAWFKRWL